MNRLWLLFAVWLFPCLPTWSQDSVDGNKVGSVASLDDRQILGAFIDGVMAGQMAKTHFAGATVSVVVGDEIAFSKGYGHADVENDVDVDAATTMFRIGSVSKLFIWTAVMQLVEDGKIDLDEDVNTYLADSGVAVPATFGQPITMNHLISHTAGFEDYVTGLMGDSHLALKPIDAVMKSEMPRRVRPPGDLASYSNHGCLLAAVVIEQVSGISWETFVAERILAPLEMENTLLEQPPKDQMPKNLSVGYTYNAEANEFESEDFEYILPAPAGCIDASADDMARFMIAHMNSGKFKEASLLKPETVAQMHSRSHWHDDRIDAMCHGFWERHQNGVRILEHGGDTNLFHSQLAILPEQKVGLFVSYNTGHATQTREELLGAFLDRYFPVERDKLDPPKDFGNRAGRFAGSYKMLRYDHSTFAKLMMIFQVVPVAIDDDDRLSIAGKSFVEVEPLKFKEEHGQRTVVFRENEAGKVTHLFLNNAPAIALQKMEWYESPYFHLGLFVGCVLLFLSAIIGWPLVHLITKGEVIDGEYPTRSSRFASWFGWFAAIGFILYLVAFAIQAQEIVNGMSPVLDATLGLSPVLAMVAVMLLLFAGLSWRKHFWRFSGRIHYLILAIAAVGLVCQLSFFNIIRWPLG